jgi:hypothetical protein
MRSQKQKYLLIVNIIKMYLRVTNMLFGEREVLFILWRDCSFLKNVQCNLRSNRLRITNMVDFMFEVNPL